MPRQYGQLLESDFRAGYVTEATGLNFPQGAVTDSGNVVFNDDGSASRRPAIDYEQNYEFNTVSVTNSAVKEFYWTSAGGLGEVSFVVVQIGKTLYFYRAEEEASVSSGLAAFTVDLDTYAIVIASTPDIRGTPCDFASGQGYLFVTHPYCTSFRVKYAAATGVLSATVITIKIRDFAGVEDNLLDDERPTTLSDAHEYNLFNQGWDFSADLASTGNGPVVPEYFSILGKYPSNAEQWWYYKDVNEKFDPNKRGRKYFGNMRSPQGGYTINAFSSDRSGKTDVGTVEEIDASYYRPSTCAFFAGRVFYSGVNYEEFTGQIYFSQVIVDNKNFGKCYQKNDPTSEILSDLLATDGGTVNIPEAGSIIKLFAMQRGLLVFASNGIWMVAGTDATPFRADDFAVTKISTQTVKNAGAIVDSLGVPIFWDDYGIWSIATQDSLNFSVQAVSEPKIKTYYKSLPIDSVRNAKGAFDFHSKTVYWVYRESAPLNTAEKFTYTHMLTLNLATGAFAKHSFNTGGTHKICGIVNARGYLLDASNIVTNAALTTVTSSSGSPVYTQAGTASLTVRFLTLESSVNFTFSTLYEGIYRDWETSTENYNFSSFLLSGYKVGSEGVTEFQSNYVLFYTKNLTNGSAFVQGLWDWTNSTSSHKWTAAQQIYPSTTLRDYKHRKLKIRGWGKSLQFKIYSETNKPFNISGWGVFISRNSLP